MLKRGGEHRFLPLLNWTLTQTGALSRVPEDIRRTLAEALRHQTFRALTVQRELLLIHRLLDKAGIEHVFLKGAFLARFAYPHPALRPVRDLDVVVRPEDAKRAQEAMILAGYTPQKDAPGMVEAHVEQVKHLPALRSPSRQIWVELHVRLDRPGGILAGMNALQNVTVQDLAGETLPFMNATDLLVYLCVHAANFHSFNNGPLIIADIGFLLKHADIEVGRIAMRAAELDVTRPVALTLALTESCWGDTWGDTGDDLQELLDLVSPEMLAVARQLCLRTFRERSNVSFAVEVGARQGKLGAALLLARKLIPSASYLSLEFGRPRNRIELGWFHVRRWKRILVRRIPELAFGFRQTGFKAEYDRSARLHDWLHTRPDRSPHRRPLGTRAITRKSLSGDSTDETGAGSGT